MARAKPADLRNTRILVTNDDGIRAQGLKILERIAKSLSNDVWVVAPEHEQSGASHSLTLTMPLRLRKLAARKYAVVGTPTDCVMMAVNQIIKDKPPQLVLSGINRGGNMAEDVTYSGTIAAAMEGIILGIPAIALSQSFANRQVLHWSTAEQYAGDLIRRLIATGWPSNVLINVNFPDVPPSQVEGVEICRQGRRDITDLVIDERVDARDQPYFWLGFRRQHGTPKRGTDLDATARGRIAVTPLHLDLTENRTLKTLKSAFGE